jgi:hypothetical protein
VAPKRLAVRRSHGAGVLAYGWINLSDVTLWRDTMHFIFAAGAGAPFRRVAS